MKLGRKAKIFLSVVGGLLLLVVVGVAALWIAFPPSKLKAMVLPRLEKSVGRKLAVEEVRLSLWGGLGIAMKNATMANRPSFSSEPFLTVENFTMKVKVLPLLRRRVEVDKVVFDGARLLVEFNAQGDANFYDIIPPTGPTLMDRLRAIRERRGAAKAPVAFMLSAFEIHNGNVRYVDEKSHLQATLERIEQKMDFQLDRSLENLKTRGQLEIGNLVVQAPTLSQKPISGLSLALSHDAKLNLQTGHLVLTEAKARLGELQLNVTGDVTDFAGDSTRVNLALASGRIDFAKVLSMVPTSVAPPLQKVHATGWAQLDAKFAGRVDSTSRPSVDGQLVVRDGKIRYANLPGTIAGLQMDIRFSNDAFAIRNAQALIGGNPVQAQVQVKNFKNPTVWADVKGSVNLAEVGKVYPMPVGVNLVGEIGGAIKAQGTIKSPRGLKVDGNVQLKNIRGSVPQLTKSIDRLDGRLAFTENTLKIPEINFASGSSDLTGSLAVGNFQSLLLEPKKTNGTATVPARVTFEVNSRQLNLDELLPPSATKREEKTPVVKTLTKPMPNAIVDGKIAVKKITWRKIDLTDVAASLSFRDGVFSLDNTTANVYTGRVAAKARVDLNKPEAPRFVFDGKLEKIEANDFLSRFTAFDDRLFGKFTMDAHIEGEGAENERIQKTLKGVGSISITDGRLINWPLLQSLAKWIKLADFSELYFRDWRNTFHIDQERLSLSDLIIGTKDAEWKASGSAGFNGSVDYRVQVRLSPSLSQRYQATLGRSLASLFTEPDGRVALDFNIGGTMMKPSFRWNLAEAKQRALQRLTEEAEAARSRAAAQAQQQLEEAQRKAQEEKAKLEEEAQRKIQEEKARLAEEAKKKAEELKKKLKEKLKP